MAFATAEQLAAQWRPLTPRERVRAIALLVIAEQLIRSKVTIAPDDAAKLAVAKQLSIELVTDALDKGPRRTSPVVTSATLEGGSYTVELPDDDGRAWVLQWVDAMYALFGVGDGSKQPAFYFGNDPQ